MVKVPERVPSTFSPYHRWQKVSLGAEGRFESYIRKCSYERNVVVGLFHKAIISAGNVLTPWAYNDDQVVASFRVGWLRPRELVEFLRLQPAEALKDAAQEVYFKIKQVHMYTILDLKTLISAEIGRLYLIM